MNVLFCCDHFDNNIIDTEWRHEYELAKRNQMKVILFNYEVYREKGILEATRQVSKPASIEPIVYRGWMMTIEMYQKLYEDLLNLNFRLINSPEQYEHCYYLPRSYDLIKDKTPRSVFYPGKNLPEDEELSELLSVFGNGSVIVKDYVKSQKHYWKEACYIPDASDLEHVKKVIINFMKKQAHNFQGGLVFREFVELEPVGVHPKSQMPLTKEYRLFVLNKKPITCSAYWSEAKYNENEHINFDWLKDIFDIVKSNFFTVDIAKKKNGEWIIMELGDGQVAEYLGEDGIEEFYQKLSRI